MYAGAIIGAVVVLILGSLIKRMMELRATPLLLWPVLLIAGAMPGLVCYDVLHPTLALDENGEPIEAQFATEEGQDFRFAVPEDGEYSVMVTAHLREYDEDDPTIEKTSYALGISGQGGWKQNVDDIIRRDSAGSGPEVDISNQDGISESGRRKGTFGEDLQDRFELVGNGNTLIHIANWEPPDGEGAAESLELQIYKAPPSRELLWGLAGMLTIVCFFLEVRYGCERVSNDVAFLMVWAVALRDGVTPLDDWQQVGKAMLPALLVGFLAVAGLSYVLMKFVPGPGSDDPKKKEKETGKE
jgi:hypothetical protein